MRYWIEKTGIHVLAFLVARCQVLFMYPFVVPFFMAAYLQERSGFSLYIVLMLGVLSKAGMVEAVHYTLVLLFLLVMLKRTDRRRMFSDNQQIAIASGVVLWAISMPYCYIVTRSDTSLLYSFLEGIMVGSFVLIFEQAFVAMRVGTRRMFSSNERFIGLFAVMLVALFGCPMVEEPVNWLFLLCSGLLIYNGFRFDSSVGVATGAAVGLVLSFRMNEVSFLAVMILLSGMIVLLRDLGKVGVLLAFLAGYILLGYIYNEELLNVNLLSAALIAAVTFLIIPKHIMKQVAQVSEGSTGLPQDVLIQEATKSRIQDFGKAFLVMEKMLQSKEEERTVFEPHGLSNVYLSGDGLSLLNVVEAQSNRLAELRKNFIRQLGQIGAVITTFPAELEEKNVQTELFESRLSESLGRLGIRVTKVLLLKDKDTRFKVYLSCYMTRERVVTLDVLERRISSMLGREMVSLEGTQSTLAKAEARYCFVEQGQYMLTTGVVRKNREGESVSGDQFSIIKLDSQKAVLMLSDGMGTGESASGKSEQVVELLEQLLSAGFCKELAIELINSFISFLADGSDSSSLDLTVVDFHTGGADFLKLGASTTFIKRRDKVEYIRSTSLPVGVLEQVEFDTCERKLYHGDMIVMVSDGVVDSIIFEDKEDYLADVIAKQTTRNAQAMAENIMAEVVQMQRENLKDDSTILVAGLWKR